LSAPVLRLGAFFAYGASYPIVFLGLIGPFLSPFWLLAVFLLASLAGLRPSRPGLVSAAAGFAATSIGLEVWDRLSCTPPSCAMASVSEDLVWLLLGLAQLLLIIAFWAWLVRSPGEGPDGRTQPLWSVLSLVPVALVVLVVSVQLSSTG
jgi:hypothetical protein